MKKMCVIGSLNVDVFTSVDRFPKPGESVIGETFNIYIGGGKGANQAFSLGRLGADVLMVGKVGELFYGPDYIKVLEQNDVKCNYVKIEKGVFPGIGLVTVDNNKENSIVYYPGANGMVDITLIDEAWEEIKSRDIFLFQLEIPTETTLYAMRKLKALGKTIIFDPAPAKDIPKEIFLYVDYITPNHTELETLSHMQINNEEDYKLAGAKLIEMGAITVIAKAGKLGAYVIKKDSFKYIKGYKVKAVDPTAAGDSFNGALAYSLSCNQDLEESIRFANAVAALATTAMGAQNSMPTIDQVNKFLSQQI
ncbi:MAG TPA: ribokinase [Clostridiaceae bacterium]